MSATYSFTLSRRLKINLTEHTLNMTAPKKETATAKASAAVSKKKATPTAKKPAAKPASKAAAKPSTAKKESAPEKAPVAVPSTTRESFSPEERKRLAKLQETMDLLAKDPEWNSFLEEQKEALYQLQDELVPNMQNVTREHLRSGESNVSSASGQHMGDAGSEAEVRDLTIRLLDKDREQMYEIDAALERIRRGTYGICEESLEPIPKGRLRVRPFCRLTVKCQEEFEKKYGIASAYSSSNSEIIGYAGLQNIQESAISLDEDSE